MIHVALTRADLRPARLAVVIDVCSGTDGAVALEDVYVAGRLCATVCGAGGGERDPVVDQGDTVGV